MKLYVAGPLFTPGDRHFIEELAAALATAGHDCFVPHQQTVEPFTPESIFAVDVRGVREAEALVAWLDGPGIDDGTACEIGMFAELVRTRPEHHRGIVGLATDWRLRRQRDGGVTQGGINFFVGGALLEYGRLVWSVDEVVATLAEWSAPSVR
jgi:hypothetical protein